MTKKIGLAYCARIMAAAVQRVIAAIGYPFARRITATPRHRTRLGLSVFALSLAMAGASAAVQAQSTYPNRPIRLIVPFPAGESIDNIARVISERWSVILGQSIIVDNRPGAGGLIGTEYVAKAVPDGYTLLMGNVGGLAILPALNSKTPYDVKRDLTPISLVATVPFFLYVSAKLPVHSVDELIAYAKAHPGKINFASTGVGSGIHLAGELFKRVAHVDIVHVPYKGVSQALPELVNGSVQMVLYPITFLPYVQNHSLNIFLVASDHRSVVLPDTPTSAEVGMPDLIAGSWHALLAPAGTSPDIIKKLNQTLVEAMGDKKVNDKIVGLGAEPVGGSPADLGKFMSKELNTWKSVVDSSGLKID
jgi:tripartite-type tricarboxylate transporter receptor subunit TctC